MNYEVVPTRFRTRFLTRVGGEGGKGDTDTDTDTDTDSHRGTTSFGKYLSALAPATDQ